jgi:hypothetical protein
LEIVTAMLTMRSLRTMVTTAHLAKSLLHDELAQIFTSLGEVELAAAKQAISDAKVSKTPQRETTLAIGHLQSAKGLFQTSAKKERSKWLATGTKAAKLSRGAYMCDAMIASAYARLGDAQLRHQYGELFKEGFQEYFNDALNTRMQEDGFVALLEEELRAYLLLRDLGIPTWEPDAYFFRVSEVLSQQKRFRIITEDFFNVCGLAHEAHIVSLRFLEKGGELELGPGASYGDLITNAVLTFVNTGAAAEVHETLESVRQRLTEIVTVMDEKGSYIKPGTDQLTSG